MKRFIIILLWFIGISYNCHAAVKPFAGLSIGEWSGTPELVKAPIESAQIGLNWRNFGISFNLIHYEQVNKINTLYEGSVRMNPMLFNGYFRLPISKRLRANLGGGFGYYTPSHDLDESIIKSADQFGEKIRDDIDNGIGTQAYGGLEYWVSKRVSIGADFFYIMFRTKDRMTVTTWTYRRGDQVFETVRDLDLTSILGMATVRVYF